MKTTKDETALRMLILQILHFQFLTFVSFLPGHRRWSSRANFVVLRKKTLNYFQLSLSNFLEKKCLRIFEEKYLFLTSSYQKIKILLFKFTLSTVPSIIKNCLFTKTKLFKQHRKF